LFERRGRNCGRYRTSLLVRFQTNVARFSGAFTYVVPWRSQTDVVATCVDASGNCCHDMGIDSSNAWPRRGFYLAWLCCVVLSKLRRRDVRYGTNWPAAWNVSGGHPVIRMAATVHGLLVTWSAIAYMFAQRAPRLLFRRCSFSCCHVLEIPPHGSCSRRLAEVSWRSRLAQGHDCHRRRKLLYRCQCLVFSAPCKSPADAIKLLAGALWDRIRRNVAGFRPRRGSTALRFHGGEYCELRRTLVCCRITSYAGRDRAH